MSEASLYSDTKGKINNEHHIGGESGIERIFLSEKNKNISQSGSHFELGFKRWSRVCSAKRIGKDILDRGHRMRKGRESQMLIMCL